MGASQVIAHRASRFANTASAPSLQDQREFALMVQEKGHVKLEAARAVGVPMLMLNQQFAVLVFKQMLSTTISLLYIATSRNAAESEQRQSKLVSDVMKSSVVAGAKLSEAAAQLTHAAIKPVNMRIRGNVRRLTKC